MNMYMSEEYIDGYLQDVVVIENPDEDLIYFLKEKDIDYIWDGDDIWLI